MQAERFLDFHGKKITLVSADGKFYVAIKPICEALNVHYKAQHRAISEDKILSQLSSIQRTVGADGKQREMLCLPEKFIYGWLFSINSEGEGLTNYKLECYEVLWNHFHGLLSRRSADLDNKQLLKDEYTRLHKEQVESNPSYKRLLELETLIKQKNASLKELDEELLTGQMKFSFE